MLDESLQLEQTIKELEKQEKEEWRKLGQKAKELEKKGDAQAKFDLGEKYWVTNTPNGRKELLTKATLGLNLNLGNYMIMVNLFYRIIRKQLGGITKLLSREIGMVCMEWDICMRREEESPRIILKLTNGLILVV